MRAKLQRLFKKGSLPWVRPGPQLCSNSVQQQVCKGCGYLAAWPAAWQLRQACYTYYNCCRSHRSLSLCQRAEPVQLQHLSIRADATAHDDHWWRLHSLLDATFEQGAGTSEHAAAAVCPLQSLQQSRSTLQRGAVAAALPPAVGWPVVGRHCSHRSRFARSLSWSGAESGRSGRARWREAATCTFSTWARTPAA